MSPLCCCPLRLCSVTVVDMNFEQLVNGTDVLATSACLVTYSVAVLNDSAIEKAVSIALGSGPTKLQALLYQSISFVVPTLCSVSAVQVLTLHVFADVVEICDFFLPSLFSECFSCLGIVSVRVLPSTAAIPHSHRRLCFTRRTSHHDRHNGVLVEEEEKK